MGRCSGVCRCADPLGTLGCADTSSHRDIRPSCTAPAALCGSFDPEAPGLFIYLRPTIDVESVTNDLVARYGVQPRPLFAATSLIIAVAPMTPEALARLRCDTAVQSVSHDKTLSVIPEAKRPKEWIAAEGRQRDIHSTGRTVN